MSVLKSLTFTAVPRAATASPEQHRRNKLIAHLQEQLAMAHAEMDGTAYAVKKRKWELTEDGQKYLVEVDKRLKRWWRCHEFGVLFERQEEKERMERLAHAETACKTVAIEQFRPLSASGAPREQLDLLVRCTTWSNMNRRCHRKRRVTSKKLLG